MSQPEYTRQELLEKLRDIQGSKDTVDAWEETVIESLETAVGETVNEFLYSECMKVIKRYEEAFNG